jgi:hypothetical protein
LHKNSTYEKQLHFYLYYFFAILYCNSSGLVGGDLSTLKVDNLSDADIVKVKTQLQANNATIDQVEPMALAKGCLQASSLN